VVKSAVRGDQLLDVPIPVIPKLDTKREIVVAAVHRVHLGTKPEHSSRSIGVKPCAP
jgi:hypothetical protein